ncbi:MAG: CvpA family protein [Clostridia bacterium]|nr:CvpA family protein [Clostridia bacterium]
MNFIFDGLLLTVCLISIVMGVKRGFIKSVMGICTLIAALFVAFAFTPTVAVHIENVPFVREIAENITDTIQSLSKNDGGTFDLLRLFRDMPEAFRQILERYGADISKLVDAVTPSADADAAAVLDLATLIAEPVVNAITGVIAFLLLFIGSVIVLKILTWLLDLIFKLPVLKGANKFFGFVIGCFNALVWMWILSALSVIFISAMSSVSPEFFNPQLIENTVILKFFADDNFGNILRMVIG